jgi:hypothetical protein
LGYRRLHARIETDNPINPVVVPRAEFGVDAR